AAISVDAATAIELLHRQRNGDLGAELQRLIEAARRELHAVDAGRKSEIVLDPRRGAGLATKGPLVEHEHRKSLRRAVNRSGKTGRSGSDHRHVIDLFRGEIGDKAEASAGLFVARSFEQRSVRTKHHRKLLRQHAKALHDHAAVRIVDRVEYLVRIAVAPEEAFESPELRGARDAHQHRTDPAALLSLLDQADATQNVGTHQGFADLGGADHQRADMRGVEGKRGASLTAGTAASERGASAKLAQLAGDLTFTMGRDRRFAIEAI